MEPFCQVVGFCEIVGASGIEKEHDVLGQLLEARMSRRDWCISSPAVYLFEPDQRDSRRRWDISRCRLRLLIDRRRRFMARSRPCKRRDSGALVQNHFRQMVDGEGQLWICAGLALLHFGGREQTHAGAVVDPCMQAPEVFSMMEVGLREQFELAE
jgi:hypothetical protein